MVLEKDFEDAVDEIAFFVSGKARECLGRGWNFYLTDDAPESYKDLKERSDGLLIPIADYGSDETIYGDSRVNSLFRFYHDVVHLENDLSFSHKDENLVADVHLRDASEYNLSLLARRILEADTKGQVAYYYNHGEFVKNQKAFVQSCLKVGIKNAIKVKH